MNRKLVERTQTGVRMEKSLLKVLKGLAEYCDLSLGDLLEGIVLHSFEGKPPFSKETRDAIDAIDVEMRQTSYSQEQGEQYLADLLDLTRQLRACKQL